MLLVARGAVYRGLEESRVPEDRSPQHYAFNETSQWGCLNDQGCYRDPISGDEMMPNVATWVVRKVSLSVFIVDAITDQAAHCEA